MKKYYQRFYKSELINTEGHYLTDPVFVWQIPSSKGDTTYGIRMHDKGFTCECMGFSRFGYCKHVKQVEKLLAGGDDYTKYQYG
jgi:hypothetical protein